MLRENLARNLLKLVIFKSIEHKHFGFWVKKQSYRQFMADMGKRRVMFK